MDEIRCPLCGGIKKMYMDTLVCLQCDKTAVADLTWCKNFIECRKGEKKL